MVLGHPHIELPLVRFARHGRRVLEACDLLEAIADDLPRKVAPIWREVAQHCVAIMPGHYDSLLHILIPVLKRRTRGDPDCEAVLARLEQEYADACHRFPELFALLQDAQDQGVATIDEEALGYALRSYFEAIRQQMAWERDVLIPLAERRLTRADYAELGTSLSVSGLPGRPR